MSQCPEPDLAKAEVEATTKDQSKIISDFATGASHEQNQTLRKTLAPLPPQGSKRERCQSIIKFDCHVRTDGPSLYIILWRFGAMTLSGPSIYNSRTLLPRRSPALCFQCGLPPPPPSPGVRPQLKQQEVGSDSSCKVGGSELCGPTTAKHGLKRGRTGGDRCLNRGWAKYAGGLHRSPGSAHTVLCHHQRKHGRPVSWQAQCCLTRLQNRGGTHRETEIECKCNGGGQGRI